MAKTRLGLTATPTQSYAAFAPKAPAVTGRLRITQLGLMATPTRRYGSFAGKTAAAGPSAGDQRLRMLMGMGL